MSDQVDPMQTTGCTKTDADRGNGQATNDTTFGNASAELQASAAEDRAVGVDEARIARAVREILLAVGEDPDRDGLRETPARIGRMYAEVFRGLREDPRVHLQKCFQEKYDEIVLVRDITFSSVCEHHLLPFMGVAHVAYLPNGKVVGLSKLARVVDSVARRPQVQERMTEQVADLIMHELDARAVAVIVEATHTCMTSRGVRKPESVCTTSVVRGLFKHNPSSRAEVMALIGNARRS